MQDDVWKAPDAAETAAAVPPEKGSDAPGDLSDPMLVPNLVMADLKAHLGGYVLAGLSYFVATFGFVLIIIGVLVGAMLPGMMMEDEALTGVGAVVGMLLYVFGILGFVIVAYPLMSASLLRALDEQRRGGATIGFASPFATLRENAGRIIGFYALVQLMVFVGMFLFYIPGLVAATIGMFAMPIVVFEGARPMQAIQLGWAHLKAHPMWHIPLWLLMFVGIIALELTIVGIILMYPVMTAFQLYAYRVAYGDEGALGSELS